MGEEAALLALLGGQDPLSALVSSTNAERRRRRASSRAQPNYTGRTEPFGCPNVARYRISARHHKNSAKTMLSRCHGVL
jgi:hypothetical protein